MSNQRNDRPLRRDYARIERERRFLLEQLPDALDPEDYHRLYDCYLTYTQLRLRRIERPNGQFVMVKLSQKQQDPDAPDDPRHRQMTTN